jgi:hypothetical protein
MNCEIKTFTVIDKCRNIQSENEKGDPNFLTHGHTNFLIENNFHISSANIFSTIYDASIGQLFDIYSIHTEHINDINAF